MFRVIGFSAGEGEIFVFFLALLIIGFIFSQMTLVGCEYV